MIKAQSLYWITVGFFLLMGCTEEEGLQKAQASEADMKIYEAYKKEGFTDKGSYLYKINFKTENTKAKSGDLVSVHYTGKLLDASVFDTSEGKNPISFRLGAGVVIKGWDEGITNLRQGEKATLVILPEYAYGNRVMASIPANSILIFEVELVKIN